MIVRLEEKFIGDFCLAIDKEMSLSKPPKFVIILNHRGKNIYNKFFETRSSAYIAFKRIKKVAENYKNGH